MHSYSISFSAKNTIHILESAHISASFSPSAGGTAYHRLSHSNFYVLPSSTVSTASFLGISLSFCIFHPPAHSNHVLYDRQFLPMLPSADISPPTDMVSIRFCRTERSYRLKQEATLLLHPSSSF